MKQLAFLTTGAAVGVVGGYALARLYDLVLLADTIEEVDNARVLARMRRYGAAQPMRHWRVFRNGDDVTEQVAPSVKKSIDGDIKIQTLGVTIGREPMTEEQARELNEQLERRTMTRALYCGDT